MKANNHKLFVFVFCFISSIISVSAQWQQKDKPYLEYIDKYSHMAVKQMKRFKIPASITLAQGLLESDAGQSTLAKTHNNHFGIKCGGNWTGPSTLHDDDRRNECFRVYHNAKESYEDHSLFLRGRSRYASLFQLKITDYEGWAHGLKKAGYATAPKYDFQLIEIIEIYKLYKYDRKVETISYIPAQGLHQVYLANNLVYVIVRNGDTFESIGKEFDVRKKRLIKYNDLYEGYILSDKNIIYLHEKKKKAKKPYTVHVIQDGESMHSISQIYGIKLKSLYKMNHKKKNYVPEVGTKLKLR